MNHKSLRAWFILALITSLSCSTLTQGLSPSGSGGLTTTATSPASVLLEWPPVNGAASYQVEAQYGSGEFIRIANVDGIQASYEHFLLPGTTDLNYRVRAVTGSGAQEDGTASATLPEFATDPLVVQVAVEPPGIFAGLPTDPNAYPTIDPNNFDPNNIDPSQLLPPGFDPSSLQNLDLDALAEQMRTLTEIGPEGGNVTFTNAAGIVYTLTIPAGAVDQVIPFSLAPLGTVTTLPMSGGLIGGAIISPALDFDVPATLTIELPATQPAPSTPLIVGFTVSQSLREFSLYPASSEDNSSYAISIDRGGTFGIAAATPQEVQAQTKKIPTDVSAMINQLIAALQTQNPGSDIQADSLIFDQLAAGLLQQIDQIKVQSPVIAGGQYGVYEVSAPLVRFGARTPAGRRLAEAVKFAEEITFMNHDSPNAKMIRDRLVAQIKAFVQKAEKDCLTLDGFYAGYLIGKMEQGLNNPMVDPARNFWGWLAEAYGNLDPIDECSFKLELKSTITTDLVGSTAKVTVTSWAETIQQFDMELNFADDAISLTGHGDLRAGPLTARMNAGPCRVFEAAPVPQFTMSLRIEPVFNESDGALKDLFMSNLDLMQSPNVQKTALSGCGKSTSLKVPLDWWGSEFFILRAKEGGVVNGWSASNGFGAGAPNVFTREFNNSVEKTSFKLTVTPPP